MKYFYHGSFCAGIEQLDARSRLHNTEEKVVYLTDNIPYALYAEAFPQGMGEGNGGF